MEPFLVDKYQETSMSGVYAIGDCATIYNNATQSTDYIALASNAVRTGIVAAHNACGHKLEGAGVQRFKWYFNLWIEYGFDRIDFRKGKKPKVSMLLKSSM